MMMTFFFTFLSLIVSFILGFILLSQGTMAAPSSNPFTVTISLNRLPTKLMGKFDYANNSTSKQDYYLSKFCNPLEGMYNQFLKVTYLEDGSKVHYRGILAKRMPPTKKDFVLVKYGESISATVELNQAYIFEKDGRYKFEYTRPLAYLTSAEMAKKSDKEELTQGGFNFDTLASAEINLVDVANIERPRYD